MIDWLIAQHRQLFNQCELTLIFFIKTDMELYGQWTIWNPVFQVPSETPVGRHASFNSPVQFTEDTNSSTP